VRFERTLYAVACFALFSTVVGTSFSRDRRLVAVALGALLILAAVVRLEARTTT
jgi:hypothetical protein